MCEGHVAKEDIQRYFSVESVGSPSMAESVFVSWLWAGSVVWVLSYKTTPDWCNGIPFPSVLHITREGIVSCQRRGFSIPTVPTCTI